MSHLLPCGCTLCARLAVENGDDRPVTADATQEDFLCDPCRDGVCAGAMRYGSKPVSDLLAHVRNTLLGGTDS